MRKPRQILLCVFVFIWNTSNYKIKVKQMIFYARFPDYSSSLSQSCTRKIRSWGIIPIKNKKHDETSFQC